VGSAPEPGDGGERCQSVPSDMNPSSPVQPQPVTGRRLLGARRRKVGHGGLPRAGQELQH